MSKQGKSPKGKLTDDVRGRDGREKTEEDMNHEFEEVKKDDWEAVANDPDVRKVIKDTQAYVDSAGEMVIETISTSLYADQKDATYGKLSAKEERFADPKKSKDLTKATEEAQRQREEEIGLVERTTRFFARAKGIILLLNIVTGIGIIGAFAMAIAAYVKSMNDGTPPPEPDPLGLTPAQRENLKNLITHWWKMPDAQLWDQITTFCDQFNPSLQAQVLLMDEIKQLSQTPEKPFVWASEDDKWDVIQALVTAYAQCIPAFQQSKSRALYTTIKAYSYPDSANPGQSLLFPRQVAADLVELALYQIINIPTQAEEASK